MTTTDVLVWLGEASIALGFSVPLVLLARFGLRGRISARWRYALWLAVPAALLATLAPSAMFRFDIAPLFDASGRVSTPPSGAPIVTAPGEEAARTAATLLDLTPQQDATLREAIVVGAAPAPALFTAARLQGLLLAAWLVGIVVILAGHGVADLRFHRAVVRARRPDDAEIDALAHAASGTPLNPARDFRVSPRLTGPVAYGVLRPAVLLPEGFFSDFSSEERRVMALHEAEHARAGHLMHRLVARLVRTLFWFHPFAWIAERGFIADQELACDQGVLARDAVIRPQSYAATLIKAAERMSLTAPAPAGGAPLIGSGPLKERTMMMQHHASLAASRSAGARGLAAVAAASTLAGLAGCVSLNAQESPFSAIALGASRADIEAAVGSPDYVMPQLDIVIYASDDRGVPMFIGCQASRTSHQTDVVRYDESGVVESVWRTPGGLVTVPDGDFEKWTRQRWVSAPETPVRGVIAPGARREDVIAAAGEPYYLMPAHDVAVYVDETDGMLVGCGVGATAPRRYVVQYDENDVVVRTEVLRANGFGRRLDSWATDPSDGDAADEDVAAALRVLEGAEGRDEKEGAFRAVAVALADAGYGEPVSPWSSHMLFAPSDALAIYSRPDDGDRFANLLVEIAEDPEQPMLYVAATARYAETADGAVLDMRDGATISREGRAVRFESLALPVPSHPDFGVFAADERSAPQTPAAESAPAPVFFVQARAALESIADDNAEAAAPNLAALGAESQLAANLAAFDGAFSEARFDAGASVTSSRGRTRSWFRNLPGGVSIFARDIDRDGRLTEILIEDRTDPDKPVVYAASSGAVSDDGDGALTMYEGVIVEQGEPPATLAFAAYVYPLDDESFERALAAASTD